MTQEEKAKAYDRVSKEVKDFFEGRQKMYSDVNKTLEFLFPELKESEGEKVRKEIIAVFKGEISYTSEEDAQKYIAWLEKQGEEKPLPEDEYERVMKALKEGFKYHQLFNPTFGGIPCIEIVNWLEKQKTSYTKKDVDEAYLKGVRDTKNEIEKQEEFQLKEGNFYECIKSYHYLGGGQYWFDKGKVYFCERDGYLRSDPNNNICVYDCENWQNCFRPYTKKTAEWSEEDEKMMAAIEHHLNNCGASITAILWLKSLKDRVGCEANCTTTKEWSEEDERMIKEIISDVKFEGYNNDMQADSYKKINWLKSLRPQNRWKPSELQLGCLSDAIEYYNSFGYPAPKLKELLDDLKKL